MRVLCESAGESVACEDTNWCVCRHVCHVSK